MAEASEAGAAPDMAREKALVDVAKVVVTAGLTLGSVMLTAFGFIERAVGLERLATDRAFAFVALLPGAAALSFLASARALGAAYDATVPARPVSTLHRAFLRFTDLGGAFGLIAVVLSCLVAVGTLLAVSLLFDLKLPGTSNLAGGAAFIVALGGMLSRSTPGRRRSDLLLAATIFVLMILDLSTSLLRAAELLPRLS
ncbi:hypothetical protein [Phreatobacter sp.]|uniref:hypothetical protein n=1 Tax=Phreatobacter sp. TaxID=1966341 RepID=UPI003F71F1B7